MQFAQPKPSTVQAPTSPSAAQAPPARLDHHETSKIRLAAYHATRVYPGAAGKILAQHLLDYEQFGFRITRTNDTAELVQDILNQLPVQR